MNRSMRRRLFACAAATAITAGMLLSGVAVSAAGATTSPDANCSPSIHDLGDPLGGGFSFADGVSSSGAVVGTAFNGAGLGRAVLWYQGNFRNLGVIAPYDESFAHGVSADGTVVGELNRQQTDVAPFVYRGGTMKVLPGLGGDFGYASGINQDGTIVGTASDGSGVPHAVVWTDYGKHIRDLGIAHGDDASFGTEINKNGVVAGDTDAGDNERPALFQNGKIVVLQPSKGTLGAAEDVNTSGRSVGLAFLPDGTQHAQTWGSTHRQGQDLGVLPGGSFASLLSIDNYGRAGGGGDTGASPATTHAVVWPGYGPLLTLRPLSGHTADDFSVVRELGTHHEAVGGSLTPAGEIHATVWACAFKQAFPLPATGTSSSARSAAVSTASPAAAAVPARVSRTLTHARRAG